MQILGNFSSILWAKNSQTIALMKEIAQNSHKANCSNEIWLMRNLANATFLNVHQQ